MDTIRNILKPGGNVDDNTMYGSGTSTNPTQTGNTGILSGEGSHLSSAQGTGATSGQGSHFSGPGATSTGAGATNLGNTPTSTSAHSSNVLNKLDPRVDSGNTNAGYGSTGASTMPGGFPAETETQNPYRTQHEDSRLAGSQNPSNTVGPTSTTNTNTQGGINSQNTTGNTGHHYARDGAALGGAAAVGEGIHHHRENDLSMGPQTTSTVTHPGGTTSTSTNTTTSTTTGPHNSSLLNKLDPRVKNDQTSTTGNPDTSGHHYGRDTAAVGGAAAVGEGVHHHRENERDRLADNSGYSGNISSGAGTSNYGGHSGISTEGPHTTDTANRLDPRVNTSGAPIGGVHQHHAHTGGGAEQADLAHGDRSREHHYGRDAAGVGAAGVGAHEVGKHHREKELEREQGYGSTTGNTTGQREHHYGRDAAGVGAAGVGAHELGKHHKEKELEREQGYGSTTGNTTDQSEHHYGRDAAGVGAAGVGAHELGKHHKEKELEKRQGYGNTSGATPAMGSSAGNDPVLVGPVHTSSLLNKLDPRVKEVSRGHAGEILDNTNVASTSKDHHYGRDAGGIGAAGVGAHELGKHHREKELEREQGYGSTTGTTTDQRDHHYGRDAAGVGAAGFGAHELGKHHNEKELEREQGYRGTGNTAGGLGGVTGLSEHEKLKHEAAVGQPGNHYGQQNPGNTTTPSHHYGRDAAGAGVVGVGAYEAEKHHKHDKDLTAAEKEQKRELKHERKEEKREAKEEKREGRGSGGGLLGFLHRDKNKTYSKEEEDEFDRQEREHNSHKGRDATVGVGAAGVGAHELGKHHKEKELERGQGYGASTGQSNTGSHLGRDAVGAGVVGTGAYEAEKHHHHSHQHTGSDTMKPLPTAPGNNGIGTGEGTQNALVMDRKRGEGYNDPMAAPIGSSIGDKLHGPERNRGVDEATGNIAGTNQHASENLITRNEPTGTHSHLGRDTAIGAGAGGVGAAAYEHEHHKHAGTSGTGNDTSGNYNTGIGAPGYGSTGQTGHGSTGPTGYSSSGQTGYGSTGQTGYGSTGQTGYGSSGQTGYGSTGQTGYDQTGSQISHDAALGAGTGGHGHPISTSGGHNKLHKDPPQHHPASQGGMTEDGRFIQPGTGRTMESGMPAEGGSEYPSNVAGGLGTHAPASGTQRGQTMGDGMQSDTGVAHPHGDRTTNY